MVEEGFVFLKFRTVKLFGSSQVNCLGAVFSFNSQRKKIDIVSGLKKVFLPLWRSHISQITVNKKI